jgi:hypothetical protein
MASTMDNGSLSMSWIGNKPYITAYMYKLDSLKDERLTSFISKCMDAISMEVEERDVADWGYKRYTIEQNPDVQLRDRCIRKRR